MNKIKREYDYTISLLKNEIEKQEHHLYSNKMTPNRVIKLKNKLKEYRDELSYLTQWCEAL